MAEKSKDRLFWINPDYLKNARQEVPGMTQEALAKEVEGLASDDDDRPITREAIANYETRRSLRDREVAFVIYKVLSIKGSLKALRAVLELLERDKERLEQQLLELDPKRIERKRQGVKGRLEDAEADLKRFKAMAVEKTTNA